MNTTVGELSASPLTVVYDGQCPFCANYMRLYRVLKSVGELKLIDARTNAALVSTLRSQGFEINRGLVVIWQGSIYSGAEGMYVLSLLGSENGLFSTMNRLFFSRKPVAKLVYPLFVAGRRLILAVLRRKQI